MGLNNIGNNVSGSDVEKIRNRGNHSDYESGFSPDDGDEFGGEDDDIFNFNFEDASFDSAGGGSSGMGGTSYDFGGFNNGSGSSSPLNSGFGTSQQNVNTGHDIIDTIADKGKNSIFAFGHIVRDIVKGVKSKRACDWGDYFRNLIIVSLIIVGAGAVLGLIGTVSGIKTLGFSGVSLEIILAGVGVIAVAIPGINISARYNVKNMVNKTNSLPVTNTVDESYDDSDFDDYLDDFDDGMLEDEDDEEYYNNETKQDNLVLEDVNMNEPEEVNFNKVLDDVQEKVPLLTRSYLVDTFKGFFGCCTPQFSDRKTIYPGTDEFAQLEAICIKALAAAAKKEVEEVASCKLESAEETFFTYELKVTRYKSLTKVEDIEKEITAYTRTSPDDKSISTSVSILGDFYIIKIFKGVKAIITLGDIFKKQETIDYFKNEKNVLPYIVGVQSDGSVLYRDLKKIESMLIVGRPRYGKSWFVINILANLVLFNKPEDVQIIIVDPKQTTMFRSISMLPHVAGFHDDSNILNILHDIIYLEGERRIKMLLDNKCDTIWDLRDRKGIKLPVLYLFMDEVISIVNNLDKEGSAEFAEYTKTIITKFPYIGIRLIMISHRAQGVIDKTVREQIGFRAAIGATEDVITEALGIKRFGTALETPGETAISISDLAPTYIRGNGIMCSDSDNVEFFKNVAKAFYKMGFDMADCSSLGCCYNRNENDIQSELLGNEGEHIQIDF